MADPTTMQAPTPVARFVDLLAQSAAISIATEDADSGYAREHHVRSWQAHQFLAAETLRQRPANDADRAMLLGIAASWIDCVLGSLSAQDDDPLYALGKSIDSVLTDAAVNALKFVVASGQPYPAKLRAILADLPHDEVTAATIAATPSGSSVPGSPAPGTLDDLILTLAVNTTVYDAYKGPDGGVVEERWRISLHALEAYEPQSPGEFVKWIAALYSEDAPPMPDATNGIVALAHNLASAS